MCGFFLFRTKDIWGVRNKSWFLCFLLRTLEVRNRNLFLVCTTHSSKVIRWLCGTNQLHNSTSIWRMPRYLYKRNNLQQIPMKYSLVGVVSSSQLLPISRQILVLPTVCIISPLWNSKYPMALFTRCLFCLWIYVNLVLW